MDKQRFIRWGLFSLTVLFTCFIWANSLQPAVVSDGTSTGIAKFFANILSGVTGSAPDLDQLNHVLRKAAHFTEYSLLGLLLFLTCAAFRFQLRHFYIYNLFIGMSVAVVDEYIQSFVEGRGSMVSDVLLDFSGVALAVLLASIVYLLVLKNRRTRFSRYSSGKMRFHM